MKIVTPLILLLMIVLGCKSEQSRTTNANAMAPEKTPSLAGPAKTPDKATNDSSPKALDFPALVGRSESDVKKAIGNPIDVSKLNATDSTGDLSYDYEFPGGSGWINFKKGKVNYLHFESKESFETFFPLGDLVGVDLRGVQPTYANAAQITYSDTAINGVKFKEVRLNSEGRYNIITLRKD